MNMSKGIHTICFSLGALLCLVSLNVLAQNEPEITVKQDGQVIRQKEGVYLIRTDQPLQLYVHSPSDLTTFEVPLNHLEMDGKAVKLLAYTVRPAEVRLQFIPKPGLYHLQTEEGERPVKFRFGTHLESKETRDKWPSLTLPFPNPFRSVVEVPVQHSDPVLDLKVMSANERLVYRSELRHDRNFVMNLETLSAGVYFFHVQRQSGIEVYKVIKQ